MADMFAQVWLWLANAWEDRPWVSLGVFLLFAALVAASVLVFGY